MVVPCLFLRGNLIIASLLALVFGAAPSIAAETVEYEIQICVSGTNYLERAESLRKVLLSHRDLSSSVYRERKGHCGLLHYWEGGQDDPTQATMEIHEVLKKGPLAAQLDVSEEGKIYVRVPGILIVVGGIKNDAVSKVIKNFTQQFPIGWSPIGEGLRVSSDLAGSYDRRDQANGIHTQWDAAIPAGL